MRVTWLFAVILGACAAACSPAPSTLASNPAAMREEVLAVSRAFDDAQRTKNRAEMDRYLAPDFRIIYASGRVSDREGFMDGFSSPTMEITDLHAEEPFYVDLGENAAVVGGIGVIRGTEGGAPFEERFRYADTFVRRDGRWYAVYIQVSPLAAPPAQN
jgi:hypothetical protein